MLIFFLSIPPSLNIFGFPNKLTISGFLEKSNVNAIEEMVNTIDQMRKFEMHVKLIQMTEELDTAGTSLIRLPGM